MPHSEHGQAERGRRRRSPERLAITTIIALGAGIWIVFGEEHIVAIGAVVLGMALAVLVRFLVTALPDALPPQVGAGRRPGVVPRHARPDGAPPPHSEDDRTERDPRRRSPAQNILLTVLVLAVMTWSFLGDGLAADLSVGLVLALWALLEFRRRSR
ncbi:hypothetical protein [Rhizohabitans arisaemae]|uniref:hypothetical protein n=1 Tax=Rhizohabitans arisaemae TaxID=2720610 RepID=UPI0024B125F6|nr:hypothetical protein [Rhizohabitans arisaemae]